MYPQSDPGAHGYRPGSPRQRAVSIALSGGIILLLLLAAILQQTVGPQIVKSFAPTTFDITPGEKNTSKSPSRATKAKTRDVKKQKVKTFEKTPSQAPVPKPDVTPTEKPAFSFLKVSSADFAAGDIAGLPKAGASSGDKGQSGASYGPGEGPGGEILYNADWFREPTDAQLATYIPASAPRSGWGMVACQTIEKYHVENCQILGESPRGSGFGRAVLNAAWQFLIVPPRVNGKAQIGKWVRIRITYGTRGGEG